MPLMILLRGVSGDSKCLSNRMTFAAQLPGMLCEPPVHVKTWFYVGWQEFDERELNYIFDPLAHSNRTKPPSPRLCPSTVIQMRCGMRSSRRQEWFFDDERAKSGIPCSRDHTPTNRQAQKYLSGPAIRKVQDRFSRRTDKSLRERLVEE